jgi:DNA primase
MAKSLVEVLQENGVELHQNGDRWVARCPFHEGDRDPSFTVYPNGTYYCFGIGCQVWGNAVKFLVDYKGMTAAEAIAEVGEDFHFPKAEKRAVIKIKNIAKTSTFLYRVAQAYHLYLKDTPGPQKYLEDRGLTQETIDKFKLGYTDGAVLNFQFAEDYELANEVGLLNKGGYESLSHRITIPNIIDDRYVDFMTGRTVINDRVKYLGLRMPKPICGFYDFRNSPILFLVEGNFDYLVLRQWGYPAIVMSGSNIKDVNYALLRDRTIVMVPDNDEQGMIAARKVEKTLRNTIILDYTSLGVKDVGELATKANAKEDFDALVREELWGSHLSNPTWEKYLPISKDSTQSLSTLKQPA